MAATRKSRPKKKPQEFPWIHDQLCHLAVPIEELSLDAENARSHGERNLASIQSSLEKWGQRLPIVVQRSTGIVRAGNGRLLAARSLGWSHIAAILCEDDDLESMAFAIADNRTAELAEWDEAALARIFEKLDEHGYSDSAATGFSPKEIDRLTAALDLAEGDDGTEPDVPDVLDSSESRFSVTESRGRVLQLGRHRMICGDCTDLDVVEAVLGGETADLVWTDPPYGVNYVSADGKSIQNDTRKGLQPLLRASLGNAAAVSSPGAVWYVAAPHGPQFFDFAVVLTDLGIWRQTLVWVKDTFVLGRSDFHYEHEAVFHGAVDGEREDGDFEPLIYGWKPDAPHRAPPVRTLSSVLKFPKPKVNSEHPTMKPVELVAFCIRASCPKGGLVFDPFGGSGTTLIAAEQTGRRCVTVEKDPRYAEVIASRWETLTGQSAQEINE